MHITYTTDSRQDSSKGSSLNKRPRAAQGTCTIAYYYYYYYYYYCTFYIEGMSARKGFQVDSEDSYDSTRNTSDEGESSDSGILQNESRGHKIRGHKRKRQKDSFSREFTKTKKSKTQTLKGISLLSVDDDVLILDLQVKDMEKDQLEINYTKEKLVPRNNVNDNK